MGGLRLQLRRSDDARAGSGRRGNMDAGDPGSLRTAFDRNVRMTLLNAALLTAQVLLGLATTCALWRLMIGPRAQDRVLALDTLYVNAMLLMLVFGMRE